MADAEDGGEPGWWENLDSDDEEDRKQLEEVHNQKTCVVLLIDASVNMTATTQLSPDVLSRSGLRTALTCAVTLYRNKCAPTAASRVVLGPAS